MHKGRIEEIRRYYEVDERNLRQAGTAWGWNHLIQEMLHELEKWNKLAERLQLRKAHDPDSK